MNFRFLSSCLAALSLSCGLQAQADDFTVKITGVFQKSAPNTKPVVQSDNEIEIQSANGPLIVQLDNIRATCNSKSGACDKEIKAFVDGTVAMAKAAKPAGPLDLKKVYVVLREAGFAKRSEKGFADDETRQLISRPFVDGIESVYVLDAPKAFRFVNRSDMKRAGLDVERLHEAARKNVVSMKAPEYGPVPEQPGVFLMVASDGLGTARIFDNGLWDRIEKEVGGPVVVAAPTRDWILFAKKDNQEAADALKEMVSRMAQNEPYPVSAVVFQRQDGSWRAN